MRKILIVINISLMVGVGMFFLSSFSVPALFSNGEQNAARLGDRTAHGGVIMAGCSTVYIGGMPAARVGDMHTCPMVEPGVPPVPHVGGPIIMGSPTVLIGGMPAARLGDMAVCTGPPDTIAEGCPSVLVGTGQAGSPQKYSEDYIKRRYEKSNVITRQMIKK
jgi:uncharacterized Zn-binding protein involved in type VI secretion